jgi:hypothetical protein
MYLGAVSTDVLGTFSLNGVLPNDPSIVGLEIALQVATADQLSEPHVIVVKP